MSRIHAKSKTKNYSKLLQMSVLLLLIGYTNASAPDGLLGKVTEVNGSWSHLEIIDNIMSFTAEYKGKCLDAQTHNNEINTLFEESLYILWVNVIPYQKSNVTLHDCETKCESFKNTAARCFAYDHYIKNYFSMYTTPVCTIYTTWTPQHQTHEIFKQEHQLEEWEVFAPNDESSDDGETTCYMHREYDTKQMRAIFNPPNMNPMQKAIYMDSQENISTKIW